jgi:DNA-binding CsgD family transcriptional regulator
MGAAGGPELRADERRRVEAVLSAADSARSLGQLLTTTLAAIEEHIGAHRSAFMLAVSGGTSTYTGVKHGSPEYVLEEYFERWAGQDALASSAGLSSFTRRGFTTIADVYNELEPSRRRFVDDFLRRTHDDHQLSFRLRTAGSEGYLTVMGPTDLDPRQRRMLFALAPGVEARLVERMPRGLPGLSPRESQVAELVALGFANRDIAATLMIESRTVEKHLERIYERLDVRGRTALAVAWATGARLDLPHPPAPAVRPGAALCSSSKDGRDRGAA